MKKYEPKQLVAISRYQNYFPSLPEEIRGKVYTRITMRCSYAVMKLGVWVIRCKGN